MVKIGWKRVLVEDVIVEKVVFFLVFREFFLCIVYFFVNYVVIFFLNVFNWV